MLETSEFEVKLENGENDKIMPNKIYANLYSQLNNEGCEILQFNGIIDHKKDGSVLKKETLFTVLKGRHKKCNPTTRDSKIFVEWRYDTTI